MKKKILSLLLAAVMLLSLLPITALAGQSPINKVVISVPKEFTSAKDFLEKISVDSSSGLSFGNGTFSKQFTYDGDDISDSENTLTAGTYTARIEIVTTEQAGFAHDVSDNWVFSGDVEISDGDSTGTTIDYSSTTGVKMSVNENSAVRDEAYGCDGVGVQLTVEIEITISDTNTSGFDLTMGTLTISGNGTIGKLSEVEEIKDNLSSVQAIVVNTGLTDAVENAFNGIGSAENLVALTLPDGWQGDLPDEENNWYGAKVMLTSIPLIIKNITAQQRWPWNGYVDISFDLIGEENSLIRITEVAVIENGEVKATVSPNKSVQLDSSSKEGEKFSLNLLSCSDQLGENYCSSAAKIKLTASVDEAKTVFAESDSVLIDLRQNVELDDVEIANVVYDDMLWGDALKANVSIGYINVNDPQDKGVVASDLNGSGKVDVSLPAKNGTYRLTHSTGELQSFATFTVTGYAPIETWADLQTAITNAGTTETTIHLTQDLTATGTDSALSIASDQKITLDLNGYTLDRGLKNQNAKSDGNVITVNGELTLIDTSEGKTGKITGSNGTSYGGVCVASYANFNMIGGSITGNTTTYAGGGVFVQMNADFKMTGGMITNNTAADNGGGVYTPGNTTLGGTAKITGNKKGTGADATDNNLYLGEGKTVTLGTEGNAPASGMSVGVTMNTPGKFAGNAVEAYTGYFSSDSDSYAVNFNDNDTETAADDYLELIPVYTITNNRLEKDAGTNHGYLTVDKEKTFAGDMVVVTVTPNSGYQLKNGSLKMTYIDGSPRTVELIPMQTPGKYSFVMQASVTTVTAEFEPIHTHNPQKVDGQAATEQASGWKDYYECKDSDDACHAYFEDATGLVPIEDLAKWKSAEGNGYIAPLTHNPQKVDGKAATDTEAGYKTYYKCDNCNKYYEDATGLVEIDNIEEWKAEGGDGYLAPTLIVIDYFDEPVEPGSETYEVKEDGIHVYADDIIFSGKTNKQFIIENEWQQLNLSDIVVDNDLIIDGLSDNVTLQLTNAEITGNITVKNSPDDVYLGAYITGENSIGGDVVSDGSFTVYGNPDASLSVKSIKTETMLYLSGLRTENMKENYEAGETVTATPKDATKPIIFTVKKDAIFPDEEEFVINDGKPFKFGEQLNIQPPVVCDENGDPLDPQPVLTVAYYKYGDGEDFSITLVEGVPTEEGNYMVVFFMPEEDQVYTGTGSYDFTIGHNIQKVDGKAATESEAGYKAYYECKGCGKYFEDATGLVEITDIAKWKAEGGNGYIAKLNKPATPDEPKSPQTGDTSNMNLWIIMLALSSVGLCASLVLGKKKKNI